MNATCNAVVKILIQKAATVRCQENVRGATIHRTEFGGQVVVRLGVLEPDSEGLCPRFRVLELVYTSNLYEILLKMKST